MTYDLRAGLAALGREERDAAPDLPVDALTARAHRLHTTHAVQYSAIGVGAAAALTIGALSADGLLLDHDPDPAPPATNEPTSTPDRTTPSPTPTPTPSATPTEVAWQPSWDLCGMPAEDLYDRDTAWDEDAETGWWLTTAWPYDAVVPVDGSFPLAISVDGDDVTDTTVEAQVTEVVAVERDNEADTGQVVGVAAGPTGGVVRGRGTGEDGLPLGSIETRIVSCDASPLSGGDGSLETALTDGGYEVLAVATIRADGADTLTAIAPVGYLGAYPDQECTSPECTDNAPLGDIREGNVPIAVPLDSPFRVAQLTGWGPLDPDVSASVDQEIDFLARQCGTTATPMPQPWLEAIGRTSGWRGTPPEGTSSPFSVSATGFRDGDQLIVQVTTTNNGTDADDAWIASPGVTVVKDGHVASYRYAWNTPFAPTRWSAGHTVQLEFYVGRTTCPFFMQAQPWPAGTYEVYVHQNMDVLPQPGYPERWRYDVVGGPFTFTLD